MLNTRLLCAILVCLTVWAAPSWSQDQEVRQLPNFDALEEDLDWAQWLLNNSQPNQSDLDRIRQRIKTIQEDAKAAAPKAREAVESLEKQPVLFAAGYWQLADWLFFGVVGSCLLLLTLWLIRNALRELVSRMTPSLPGHDPHSDTDSKGLAVGALVWGTGVFNLVLWLSTILCLFLIWGVPYSQIKTWTSTVIFTELSLARIEISVSDVVVALGIFIGLVILTKVMQRQLHERLLSWAPLDIGVRNALWSVTGYIGIIVAIVASLLALGVNLSQLFLVISALSVGIGFGLQSVVHDFIKRIRYQVNPRRRTNPYLAKHSRGFDRPVLQPGHSATPGHAGEPVMRRATTIG